MRRRKKSISIAALLIILVAAFVFAKLDRKAEAPLPQSELQVHFIDVGQADCILLQCEGEAMLVDAGNNDDGALVLKYLENAGVTYLNYAVGTHPHEDHIGGLDTVIRSIPIGKLMMPKAQTNTATFEDVLDAIEAQGLRVTAPKQGDSFTLGSATVTAVHCYDAKTDRLNNVSLMFRVDFGETSFLLTGDAEKEAEQAVLDSGVDIQCDVLKAGHHGSSTSSSRAFLDAVDPDYAVITCGKGNSYGHPHRETMQAFNGRGISVYRTDEMGSVRVYSDGKTLRWETELGG